MVSFPHLSNIQRHCGAGDLIFPFFLIEPNNLVKSIVCLYVSFSHNLFASFLPPPPSPSLLQAA